FFFFSSRRRHTRCLSDWSSDVCSSDLVRLEVGLDLEIWIVVQTDFQAVHDELAQICVHVGRVESDIRRLDLEQEVNRHLRPFSLDRKSTRLNSSHLGISYAVFCLKKKK